MLTMDNKTIIIIDPLPKLMPQFIKLADEYQDILYTVSLDKEISYHNNFQINLFDHLDSFIDILNESNIKPDIIFSLNEIFAKQVDYLINYFNLDSIQNNLSLLREKSEMKKLFEKYKIPHAKGKSYPQEDINQVNFLDLSYPIVIKPSAGYASAGVKKVNNKDELLKQLRNISLLNNFKFSHDKFIKKEIILEEFLDGPEYCCDSFWKNGRRIFTVIHRNININSSTFPDWLYFINPFLDKKLEEKLIRSDEHIHYSLNTLNGFTHTEYKIVSDIPHVIETTNRPGAGGGFFHNILLSTNIDSLRIFYKGIIHDEKINNVQTVYDKRFYYFFNVPQLDGEGVIAEIHGLKKLESNNYVLQISNFLKTGNYMTPAKIKVEYPMTITGRVPISNDLIEEVLKLNDLIDIEYTM